MKHCPICNGKIDKYKDFEECELCGTTYKVATKERIAEIINDEYAKLSRKVWGR